MISKSCKDYWESNLAIHFIVICFSNLQLHACKLHHLKFANIFFPRFFSIEHQLACILYVVIMAM